jgi:hypothetical protein
MRANEQADVPTTRQQARAAGRLYFLLALTAPIGLLYVPGRLIVSGDAAETANRVAASPSILRLGIASELFHQSVGIFLVLALYRLFRQVSEKQAVLMVVLSLLPVPIVFGGVIAEIAALFLASGADYLKAFDKPQLDALIYLAMRLHGRGITVASIFWGLWLFPFGALVIRSRFIPRVLGYLLWIAGAAYLASATATLVLPQFKPFVDSFAVILEVCELPIIFWLLIWGAREPASAIPATVPRA